MGRERVQYVGEDLDSHGCVAAAGAQRAQLSGGIRLALTGQLFGLDPDHARRLPEKLAAVTLDEVNQACRTWLRPDDTLSVVVATADTMVPALEGIGAGTPEVVAHDSY